MLASLPLLQQLDQSMSNMVRQKQQRLEQIAADQAELDALNEQIKAHIQPNVVSWYPRTGVRTAASSWQRRGSVQTHPRGDPAMHHPAQHAEYHTQRSMRSLPCP